MRGNAQVIEQLNKALAEELTAIHQYFVHAEMCKDWGYHGISAYIKKQAIDEMKHAESLIERILFLEATPKMDKLALTIGENVRTQLENDLALEHDAVNSYNQAVRISREAGDQTSADLFDRHLADEEKHVDWLETQLHMISEIGYERYLGRQIGVAAG
jgi:bacterioferritin